MFPSAILFRSSPVSSASANAVDLYRKLTEFVAESPSENILGAVTTSVQCGCKAGILRCVQLPLFLRVAPRINISNDCYTRDGCGVVPEGCIEYLLLDEGKPNFVANSYRVQP